MKITEANTAQTGSESPVWPLHADILESLDREAKSIVAAHAAATDHDEWNAKEIVESLAALHQPFANEFTIEKVKSYEDAEALTAAVSEMLRRTYEEKCAALPAAVARAEAVVTLRSVDAHWMDHIDDMSHLREQVAFSGYAQRDPVIEYQDQGFRRFQGLITRIDSTIVRTLLQAEFSQFLSPTVMRDPEEEEAVLQTNADQIEGQLTGGGAAAAPSDQPLHVLADGGAPHASVGMPPMMQGRRAAASPIKTEDKTGRNDPCPCGSGKKYKKCHGKEA